MLPVCAAADSTYLIYQSGGVLPFAGGFPSDSPAASCAQFATSLGGVATGVSGFGCQWSGQPTQVYPVVKVCEPMFDGAPYDYAAGGALFGFAFTGVMILYFASLGIGHVIKAVRDM